MLLLAVRGATATEIGVSTSFMIRAAEERKEIT